MSAFRACSSMLLVTLQAFREVVVPRIRADKARAEVRAGRRGPAQSLFSLETETLELLVAAHERLLEVRLSATTACGINTRSRAPPNTRLAQLSSAAAAAAALHPALVAHTVDVRLGPRHVTRRSAREDSERARHLIAEAMRTSLSLMALCECIDVVHGRHSAHSNAALPFLALSDASVQLSRGRRPFNVLKIAPSIRVLRHDDRGELVAESAASADAPVVSPSQGLPAQAPSSHTASGGAPTQRRGGGGAAPVGAAAAAWLAEGSPSEACEPEVRRVVSFSDLGLDSPPSYM